MMLYFRELCVGLEKRNSNSDCWYNQSDPGRTYPDRRRIQLGDPQCANQRRWQLHMPDWNT